MVDVKKELQKLNAERQKTSNTVNELEKLLNDKKLEWLKLTAIIEWLEKQAETGEVEKTE